VVVLARDLGKDAVRVEAPLPLREVRTTTVAAQAAGSLMATIEALEHDTGIVPLGSDPDHCAKCRCAARGHGETVTDTFTTAGGTVIRRDSHCEDCGTSVEVDA
jgi:hypothetical protein